MASCCGGSSRKNAAAFVVMGLLLVVTSVGWWREAHKGPPAVPPVETVEVLVAATDMTTGTTFTKDNIGKLTTSKTFPKSVIDPEAKIITDPKDMIGKRLTRARRAGEFFFVADVASKTTRLQEPVKDIMSLPFTPPQGSGFIGPGSRVDIVAGVVVGTKRVVFTLLPDMYVLAVNNEDDFSTKPPTDMNMVSFAVDERQAKLIAFANQANCNLELVPRHPDAPKREFDYDATLARVKGLLKQQDHIAPPPREGGER
jgi:Flp pilus assembly protein CpaB